MNKAIILAGGQGKRMKADMPKPLFKVLGEPMLEWVISACEESGISDICVIKGFCGEMIDDYLGGRYTTALQAERLGTGHAVMQGVPFLKEDISGNTLVLCGDAPFIDAGTISDSLKMHTEQGNSVTVITAELVRKGRLTLLPSGTYRISLPVSLLYCTTPCVIFSSIHVTISPYWVLCSKDNSSSASKKRIIGLVKGSISSSFLP